MHVMRNLGEWKKPISRIFGVSAPAGSFLGLVQPICAFCTFYHILWFYLSHAYRCFLCYALLHRFVCNLFYSSKHLCACFITFHAAFFMTYSLRLWLFICFCVDINFATFLSDRFYGCFYIYLLMRTAYNANIKTYDVIRPSRIAP